MTEKIIRLNSVDQYCQLFGLPDGHPLIRVVDLKDATRWPTHFTIHYGVYALFLKDTRCGDIRYGKQTYDYQEGTVTSFAPGQVVETVMEEGTRPKALGLLFHPDLIQGTALAREIKTYSFLSYASSEALHLSEDEKGLFQDCLQQIRQELERPSDRLSKRIMAHHIQLLLDYCLRFYERQFHTRAQANRDVLTRFESLLNNYFLSELPQKEGLPTVRYFADKVFLSPNYFGDLIKKETGMTAQELIRNRLIEQAKEYIVGTDKKLSQIAYELGFQYSQHFNRLFKKSVGYTPNEYRKQQSALG